MRQTSTLDVQPRALGPAWLDRKRASLSEALARDGFPTRKTEEFRFTPVAPFLEEATLEAGGPAGDALARAGALGHLEGAVVTLVDGAPGALPSPSGVELRPLREALESGVPGLASLDAADPFARLNGIRFQDGLLVTVGSQASADTVIQLVHVSSQGGSTVRYPRVVVTVGAGASCTLVERMIGSADGGGATHAVIDVTLGAGARLEHVRVGRDVGLSTALVTVRVAEGAFYGSSVATLGGRICRTALEVSLEGEGAEAELAGIYLAGGMDHLDHHLRVEHRVPRCTSRMRYHGIVDGKATAVFDGITVVHRDAQGTEAHQENRNLLLSEGATIHTKPHLEIDADDVKCSHGTTVGSLDEQALFYLRARGISEHTARAMLTEAFVQAPIDAFPEVAKELVRELARAVRVR